MKKIISLVLILTIMAGILISCGGNPASGNTDKTNSNDKNNTSAAGDNQTVAENTTQGRIEPNLPEKDFEGYTFTFFAHRIDYAGDWIGDGDPRELVANEENGEPINDAVYRRNRTIEDKYNITIKMVTNSNDSATLKKAVSSGDSTYDAAVIFNNLVPSVVTAGLLVNTDKLSYIDLSKPWWDPAVNAMSIDHKNYLMSGDLLILDNEATNVLLFNKDLMANLGIDLPYNLVKEGKWTMDKLNEMVKGAAKDLNGDGVMDSTDQWGFGTFNDTLHAFLVSGGGALAVKDANDIPYMDFTSQRNLLVLDKAMNLLYNTEYVVNQQSKNGFDTHKAFQENRIVFLWGRMHLVEYYRAMESNFGIVPLPKYDESQDKYYSLVNPYTGVLLGVPGSSSDLDRTSIILEALSAESKYTLQPAYYNVVLQGKYVRDDESAEMLDIIFGSRVYDIGAVYSFGSVFNDFNNLAATNDRNITSYYDKKSGAMQKAIDKVVTAFQSMS